MKEIDAKVEAVIQAIKTSEAYTTYCSAFQRIQEYPDVERQVNEFRKKSYEIQKRKDTSGIYDDMIHLQDEYAALRRNPLVNEYLQADIDVCKLIQNINWKIIQSLDFQMGFVDEE